MNYLIAVNHTNTRGPEEPIEIQSANCLKELKVETIKLIDKYAEEFEAGAVEISIVNENSF